MVKVRPTAFKSNWPLRLSRNCSRLSTRGSAFESRGFVGDQSWACLRAWIQAGSLDLINSFRVNIFGGSCGAVDG